MTQQLAGWWKAADSSLILPEELGKQVLLGMHHVTHLGTRKMQDLIRHAKITMRDVRSTIENIVLTCKACQLTNAARHVTQPTTGLENAGVGQEHTGRWTSLR